MNMTEEIRRQVVAVFQPGDKFTTRIACDNINLPGGMDEAVNRQAVSTTLATWAKQGAIYRKLKLHSKQNGARGVRQYVLKRIDEAKQELPAALPGGTPGRIATPKIPKLADLVQTGGQALIGTSVIVSVRDVKSDGSMLVEVEGGSLFVMRKIDW